LRDRINLHSNRSLGVQSFRASDRVQTNLEEIDDPVRDVFVNVVIFDIVFVVE